MLRLCIAGTGVNSLWEDSEQVVSVGNVRDLRAESDRNMSS